MSETTTAVRPSQLRQPPVRGPLPHGLFSVVTPVTPADPHWQQGQKWQALDCTPLRGIGDPACDPGETVGLPKQFGTSLLDAEATAFTVYGEFSCSPVGYSLEELQSFASQRLLAGEQSAVERFVWTGELGNSPAFATSDSTDLGTVPTVLDAIGSAEQYLGDSGVPGVIHLPRGWLSQVPGDRLASGMRTLLGTQLVAGGGYPMVGKVFVTGPLFVLRSEPFTSSDRPGDLMDRGQNLDYAVAERTYLVGFDPCPVGVITVTGATPEEEEVDHE